MQSGAIIIIIVILIVIMGFKMVFNTQKWIEAGMKATIREQLKELKNNSMCEYCHQPDWFCQYRNKKSEYGSKPIKNERTGYGTLTLDFEKRTIVVQFPDNWDEMSNEEQYLWIKEHIKP